MYFKINYWLNVENYLTKLMFHLFKSKLCNSYKLPVWNNHSQQQCPLFGCSDVGIYDRVVIQELLKNMAQVHQLDRESQKEFKGNPTEIDRKFHKYLSYVKLIAGCEIRFRFVFRGGPLGPQPLKARGPNQNPVLVPPLYSLYVRVSTSPSAPYFVNINFEDQQKLHVVLEFCVTLRNSNCSLRQINHN